MTDLTQINTPHTVNPPVSNDSSERQQSLSDHPRDTTTQDHAGDEVAEAHRKRLAMFGPVHGSPNMLRFKMLSQTHEFRLSGYAPPAPEPVSLVESTRGLNRCGFCKKSNVEEFNIGYCEPFREAHTKQTFWAHKQCLMWTPETNQELDGSIFKLAKSVEQGEKTKCKKCGEVGATIRCQGSKKCRFTAHYACAVETGCYMHVSIQSGTGTLRKEVYCPQHLPSNEPAPYAAPSDKPPHSTTQPSRPHERMQPRTPSDALKIQPRQVLDPDMRWKAYMTDLDSEEEEEEACSFSALQPQARMLTRTEPPARIHSSPNSRKNAVSDRTSTISNSQGPCTSWDLLERALEARPVVGPLSPAAVPTPDPASQHDAEDVAEEKRGGEREAKDVNSARTRAWNWEGKRKRDARATVRQAALDHERQLETVVLADAKCGFCNKGHEASPACGPLLRAHGPESTMPLHVHKLCALWTPKVVRDGETGELRNVSALVQSCKQSKCAICMGAGATIRCSISMCMLRFHYICAVQAGCRMALNSDPDLGTLVRTLLCPEHTALNDPSAALPVDHTSTPSTQAPAQTPGRGQTEAGAVCSIPPARWAKPTSQSVPPSFGQATEWRPAGAASGMLSKESAGRAASNEDPSCSEVSPCLKRAHSGSELEEPGCRRRYVCRKSTGGGAGGRGVRATAELNRLSSSSVQQATQDEDAPSDRVQNVVASLLDPEERKAMLDVDMKKKEFAKEFRIQQRLASEFKACNSVKARAPDEQLALTGQALRGSAAGKPQFRADLRTFKKMKEKGLVTTACYTGHVPGIPVGSRFFCRAEMHAVGLHKHWMSGICKHKEEPQAVSVVMSGMYEDEKDDGEVVEYIGEGGVSPRTQKQYKDQVASKGNLALLKSEELGLPVRVIRGVNDANAPIGKVFTYDGLYKVEAHSYENGKTNFKVYKFQLRRLPDQPKLHSIRVVFTRGSAHTGNRNKYVLDEDISGGLERHRIRVVNEVDSQPSPRLRFKYTTCYVDSTGEPIHMVEPAAGSGCQCTGGCRVAAECACAAKSKVLDPKNKNLVMPYLEGKLTWACSMVYECGPHCQSPASSSNRVIQHGIRYHLEVFRTKNRGWGVRSRDTIPPGAFVCTYTGELITNEEANNVQDTYLFNIDGVQTAANKEKQKHISTPELEPADENETSHVHKPARYCVNAMRYGSVARFINHSCVPNLFVQPVMQNQQDTDMHYICLFAMETVYPLTELTYDYGYPHADSIKNCDGTAERIQCRCGAATCSGVLLCRQSCS